MDFIWQIKYSTADDPSGDSEHYALVTDLGKYFKSPLLEVVAMMDAGDEMTYLSERLLTSTTIKCSTGRADD